MRILFIHNRYQQPGGEDVAVELESQLLKDKGHDVRVLFFQNSNPEGSVGKITKGMRAIYDRNSYRVVKNEIEVFRPDVVHVHNFFYAASPSIFYAAKKMNVPAVLTLHNYRLICANALLLRHGQVCELCVNNLLPLAGIRYRCYHNSMAESAFVTFVTSTHKLIRTWDKNISRLIVLTQFAQSRFVGSSIRVDEQKLFIKPNFIPDPGLGETDREDFFLFVGRLSYEKGIDVLANAFAGLPTQKLVVIGDAADSQAEMARFLDNSNITLKGRLNKDGVLAYMKRCKALIFPSTWYEGLPFVIIEAFATGTPVIASRLGSMAELVNDKLNGFLFEPGNVTDLQEKIHLFLQTERQDRNALYENARTTYVQNFSPEKHYQTILTLYETVIAEKRF